MTAPNTNVEKQTRRHKPSLGGIAIAGVAVVLIILAVVTLTGGENEEVPAAEATATE